MRTLISVCPMKGDKRANEANEANEANDVNEWSNETKTKRKKEEPNWKKKNKSSFLMVLFWLAARIRPKA